MMVDGDHLLVRPKHAGGTNDPSPMCPKSSRPDKTIRHYQAQDLVCSRSLTSPFVLECLFGVPDSLNCPDLQCRAPLLTLPRKTKINVETLGHYPNSKRLTATQLISLHLLLYKPAPGCESDDPHFGPYISFLPRDFGSHPLTWIVHRTLGAGSRKEHRLLDLLPPSVLSDLLLLETRFWKDWEVVHLYVVGLRTHFRCQRPFEMTLIRTTYLICLHGFGGQGRSQN